MNKNINDVLKEVNSNTPLQDWAEENGGDKFMDVMRNSTKFAGDIREDDSLDKDVVEFLDKTAAEFNTFFMGKNGKGYWLFDINFSFSCFTGYVARVPSTIKQRFAPPPADNLYLTKVIPDSKIDIVK